MPSCQCLCGRRPCCVSSNYWQKVKKPTHNILNHHQPNFVSYFRLLYVVFFKFLFSLPHLSLFWRPQYLLSDGNRKGLILGKSGQSMKPTICFHIRLCMVLWLLITLQVVFFLWYTETNMYSCIDYVSVLAGGSTNLKIQHSNKYLYALDYLKIRKSIYKNKK